MSIWYDVFAIERDRVTNIFIQSTPPTLFKEQPGESPTTQLPPPTGGHQLPQGHSRQSSESSVRRYSAGHTEPFPPFPQQVTTDTGDELGSGDADARRH